MFRKLSVVGTVALLAGSLPAYADHTVGHNVRNLKGGLGAVEQRVWDLEQTDPVPGPPGGPGPAGADGQSVISTPLSAGDPNCPTGGSQFDAANGTTFACNGEQGPEGLQGPVGPEGTGQTINLTIDPIQFPGIVAEDFVTLFPDAVNNTARLSFAGCTAPAAVIINGPGVEIQKVEGFDGSGNSDDHSGLAQELPIVFETADESANNCLASYIADFQSGFASPAGVEIDVSNSSGSFTVSWTLANYEPDAASPSTPGFDGRTRYVLVHSPGPDNVMDISRFPSLLAGDESFNPLTDREVSGSPGGRYPNVVEDPNDDTRLILTYDFVEGGDLLSYVTEIVDIGTTSIGKLFIDVTSDPFGSPVTVQFQGCFPVKYEQFTGFGQDIKLKERAIFDCDTRTNPGTGGP